MASKIEEYVKARWSENSTKRGLIQLVGGALFLLFPSGAAQYRLLLSPQRRLRSLRQSRKLRSRRLRLKLQPLPLSSEKLHWVAFLTKQITVDHCCATVLMIR